MGIVFFKQLNVPYLLLNVVWDLCKIQISLHIEIQSNLVGFLAVLAVSKGGSVLYQTATLVISGQTASLPEPQLPCLVYDQIHVEVMTFPSVSPVLWS